MKKSKYEVFMKIVEMKSLSKAADICNYSQSAVSQIVTSLENELGIVLLNRNHSGVWLTSDGEQILPYIRNLSRAHTELAEKASEILGIESGVIRIGTYSSVSCHLLPSILKDFKDEHPNIKFELYQGEYNKIKKWILDGSVDLGFMDLPPKNEFDTIHLIDDRLLAIISKDHEYADMDSLPINYFENQKFILLEEGAKKETLDLFKKEKVKLNVEYVSEDDYTIMSMVENGLGISILGELVLQKNNYNIIMKETVPRLSRSIGVSVKNRKNTSIAVKAFLDYIENNKDVYIK